jgi:hypothetical protein
MSKFYWWSPYGNLSLGWGDITSSICERYWRKLYEPELPFSTTRPTMHGAETGADATVSLGEWG